MPWQPAPRPSSLPPSPREEAFSLGRAHGREAQRPEVPLAQLCH